MNLLTRLFRKRHKHIFTIETELSMHCSWLYKCIDCPYSFTSQYFDICTYWNGTQEKMNRKINALQGKGEDKR